MTTTDHTTQTLTEAHAAEIAAENAETGCTCPAFHRPHAHHAPAATRPGRPLPR